MQSFKSHKLSMREAAEALGIDYWDFQELIAKEARVPASDLTEKEVEGQIRLANKLAKKRRK